MRPSEAMTRRRLVEAAAALETAEQLATLAGMDPHVRKACIDLGRVTARAALRAAADAELQQRQAARDAA